MNSLHVSDVILSGLKLYKQLLKILIHPQLFGRETKHSNIVFVLDKSGVTLLRFDRYYFRYVIKGSSYAEKTELN